jgi:hypothetical protein
VRDHHPHPIRVLGQQIQGDDGARAGTEHRRRRPAGDMRDQLMNVLAQDVDALLSRRLVKHAPREAALVVGDDGVATREPLRHRLVDGRVCGTTR